MPGRVCARALDGARAGLGRPGRRKTAGGLMALQALLNTPLALRPAAAQALIAAAARTDAGLTLDMQARSAEAGYTVIGGVALIPVHGVRMHKLGVLQSFWGMAGCDGLGQNIWGALADPGVHALALDMDSPGGMVAGCFDLADAIFEARGEMPIWAMVNEQACSAAYALASSADVVTVPRTGTTGSIGILYLHVDVSRAQRDAGLNVTLLNYGARKADGHPARPLSEDARARLDAEIATMGELFVETVARNRGLSPQAVRNTEETTYLGAAGLNAGLADAALPPDAAYQALVRQFN